MTERGDRVLYQTLALARLGKVGLEHQRLAARGADARDGVGQRAGQAALARLGGAG